MFEQIRKYYENYDEEGRLFRDNAHIPEYLTTIRYFDRLIKSESNILDACAGSGRYSFYLANKGHVVTACDLVEHHINIIKSNPGANKLAAVEVCNVLDLSRFDDNCFDVVLCMGAMYHLPSEAEKVQAICECMRVCRSGGLVVLSYLNYFAVIAAELHEGLGNLDELLEAFDDNSDCLFKATTPEKMERYLSEIGLEKLYNIGTDGISFILSDKVNIASDAAFEKWMEYIYAHCEESSTLGYSMHGLIIGKKR